MNDNSKAITILCSAIGASESINPYTPGEWDLLAKKLVANKREPKDILFMSSDEIETELGIYNEDRSRLERLLDRAGSLAFEIEKYRNIGIQIVTRADSEYPQKLKKKLKTKCPPLFYVAGDASICDGNSIGFVGSRNIEAKDIRLTKTIVKKVVEKGYSVVSGGARGVDQVSQSASLSSDGKVIIYVSDSLMLKLRDSETIRAIRDGKAVLLSVAKPDAGFNTGIAMMRNKYIYAQSEGTVVIRSDYNKGGTWSGATDNLKNQWCQTLCVQDENYKGNMELIKMGARPISDSWDVDFDNISEKANAHIFDETEQLSIFQLFNEK